MLLVATAARLTAGYPAEEYLQRRGWLGASQRTTLTLRGASVPELLDRYAGYVSRIRDSEVREFPAST